MRVRLYTVQEANAIIPRLSEMLLQAKDSMNQLRDLCDHLVDLRIIWGDAVEEPACKGHDEYEAYRSRFTATESRMQTALAAISDLGCEVKDVEAGLIDFHARRGEDVVFLCWRAGEAGIMAWHARTAGYAGRRSMEEF